MQLQIYTLKIAIRPTAELLLIKTFCTWNGGFISEKSPHPSKWGEILEMELLIPVSDCLSVYLSIWLKMAILCGLRRKFEANIWPEVLCLFSRISWKLGNTVLGALK